MSEDAPDFEKLKPKPPKRYIPVRELREMVSSREKMLAVTRPFEEVVALIVDEYRADEASAAAFVEFLRGGPADEPPNVPSMDRIHVVADPDTGEVRRVESEPGSIPPRPL